MKSLFTVCLLFIVIGAQAQFTSNRLAVTRVGDESTALKMSKKE